MGVDSLFPAPSNTEDIHPLLGVSLSQSLDINSLSSSEIETYSLYDLKKADLRICIPIKGKSETCLFLLKER